MVFGSAAFVGCLGHEGGGLMNGISALTKEAPESSFTLSTMWGHSEEMVIYAPGSRLSPDTRSASIFINEL